MELVSNCPPDLRIYKPSYAHLYPPPRKQSEHRSRLLHRIHNSYCKALERLNLRVRPGMTARFIHGGGICLGLLDPVSNIVANTLISYGRAVREPLGEGDELVYVPEEKLRDLERRSLEGLVTFLTRLFPYLAECEATRFLLLADADLLVAVRIVAMDLGMSRFGDPFHGTVNHALWMALKCAALAAKHPNPDHLVYDWLAISCRLQETTHLVDKVRRRSPLSSLGDLAKLLDGSPPVRECCGDLSGLWRITTLRRPLPRSMPYKHTPALRGTLQDAIHSFYLDALARLPVSELRSRFHRSLLQAGHCYGPLDPVSNIIINTIWYDAAFPPTVELELDMIGTSILHRMENRSLYGLVSFVCTRYHPIDFNHAMECLLETECNLHINDCYPDGEAVVKFLPGFTVAPDLEKAFLAATTAACHPNPDAQAKLLLRCSRDLIPRGAFSVLQSCGQLSSRDVKCLARFLCPEAACFEQPLRPFPRPEYLGAHIRLSKKINAALSTYEVMPNGEPMYQLHTVCGVNDNVLGPVGIFRKCYRSHVNFLATPKVSGFSASTTPLLFFAEISNYDEDISETQPFCCSVAMPLPCAERMRCLYCDYMGIKIVHPTVEDFHGRKLEFEKMVCGEDPCNDDFDPALMQPYYTNMNIIGSSLIMTDNINGRVDEDCLYNDLDEYDSDFGSMTDECHILYPRIMSCCRSY